MKKQYYHRLTVLFFTLTILLFMVVGFFMCYSDGIFTLGPIRIVLVEHTQDVRVVDIEKKVSKVGLPAIPSTISYIHPNGVSNRIRHWDTKTHQYADEHMVQYVYTISKSTTISTPTAIKDTNVYITPTGHSEQVIFNTYVYENIVQKLEQAILQQIQVYPENITYAITYEYENENDIRPAYVRFEVYTPYDNGNSINWNLLVYNN